MQLSASFCRTQQAIHHARASNAQLDNVRVVAGKAAIAWGQEARIADQREARRLRLHVPVPGVAVTDPFDDEDNSMFAENPDFGLPDA